MSEAPSTCRAACSRSSTSPATRPGIPALGLWAQVPHYVSSMPYPAGSVSLLEGLHALAGLTIDYGQLPSDAKAARLRLDELVAQNPQHQAMVTQLEELVDQGVGDAGDPGADVRLRSDSER